VLLVSGGLFWIVRRRQDRDAERTEVYEDRPGEAEGAQAVMNARPRARRP
jgi:hypothetical protein